MALHDVGGLVHDDHGGRAQTGADSLPQAVEIHQDCVADLVGLGSSGTDDPPGMTGQQIVPTAPHMPPQCFSINSLQRDAHLLFDGGTA